jgi:hypothetical protein
MQPVALMLEGAVQCYWRRWRRSKLSRVSNGVLDGFERVVGYTWVMGWLVWEAPRRNSAVIYCYTSSSL